MKANTPLNQRTPVFAANNNGVKYCIMSGNGAGLFQIDEDSGVITTTMDFEDVQNLQSSYNLTIRAYDPLYVKLYDEASVPIMLTEWIVDRNNAARAIATSMYGCTIEELANEIGLEVNEYLAWLTFKTDSTGAPLDIQLEDGSTISASALTVSHILAPNQKFQIPNTIFSAFFGDEGQRAAWEERNGELVQLGFNVVSHCNDDYGCGPVSPKDPTVQSQMLKMLGDPSYANNSRTAFYQSLTQVIDNKWVHGVFFYGHGDSANTGFGTSQGRYDKRAKGIMSDEHGPIGGVLGPKVWITYASIDNALNYRLAAVIVHACYSDGPNAESLKSNSRNAIFKGHDDYVHPYDLWHMTDIWVDGAQCTLLPD